MISNTAVNKKGLFLTSYYDIIFPFKSLISRLLDLNEKIQSK